MTPRPKLRVVRAPAGRKRAGFIVPEAFVSNVARLSSGNACTLLLLALWARSAGRSHDWTPALRERDLALICRCHVRTIERLILALDERGVAEVRRPGKGLVEVRLKYREWAALPDHGNRTTSGGAQKDFLAEMKTDAASHRGVR